MPDPLNGPLRPDTPRVRAHVVWRGQQLSAQQTFDSIAFPNGPSHYQMDRAVWDVTVRVRRELAKAKYPDADFDRQRPLRNEYEAFCAIRNYLAVNVNRRFVLVPPGQGGFDRWRAYFKGRSDIWEIEANPPVGVGSTDYMAIENLLRFTENREPLDG